MTRPIRTLAALFASGLAALAPAQGWTDDELAAATKGLDTELVVQRLQEASKLLADYQLAAPAMAARIHGDHREYMLKIERLVAELTAPRWTVREQAERTLIEIGARAQTRLQERADGAATLEETMRCRRILDAIRARGSDDEDRQLRILRGLVTAARYAPPDERMRRALRSALGHTENAIVEAAIGALGAQGQDEDADAVRQLLDWKGGVFRQAALSALFGMRCPRAVEICTQLLAQGALQRHEQFAWIAALRGRAEAQAALAQLRGSSDALVAQSAAIELPTPTGAKAKVELQLAQGAVLAGVFAGFGANCTIVEDAIEGLPEAAISFSDSDAIEFPNHAAAATAKARVFLAQGSLVSGDLVALDDDTLIVETTHFGRCSLPRGAVQGVAVDPKVDRLVGASPEHDRIRLLDGAFLDGTLTSISDGALRLRTKTGEEVVRKLDEVAGLLMARPRAPEPDVTPYVRFHFTDGDRVLGFLGGSSRSHQIVAAPLLGAIAVPTTSLLRVEAGVGGGAMWGFTLVTDYGENRIVEYDDQGRVVFKIEDVYGAWDAESLDNGNLLITEFPVSRVQEVDRAGNVVWEFDDVKNPYDADRLPNGNTLIADTFGGRVVEVSPAKEIVWKYDAPIRPFDADRLPNGNTLIADVLKDRVLEVSPAGEVVWEATGLNNLHDADRLPNGNTLVALRSKGSIVELDKDGVVVWELTGLNSPSDADRLPNGHTIVAEHGKVREFDRRKQVVWEVEVNWAVECNRY